MQIYDNLIILYIGPAKEATVRPYTFKLLCNNSNRDTHR